MMRGSAKGGNAHAITYRPITSAVDKNLYLRDDQASSLKGRRVFVVDDVISQEKRWKHQSVLFKKRAVR